MMNFIRENERRENTDWKGLEFQNNENQKGQRPQRKRTG